MIRQRLINCDFLNASTYLKLSNRAKLLYLMMITNADDLGFVSNAHNIIEELTNNEDEQKQVSLELLKNDYISALVELIDKTYIYRFVDKHNNEIFVIKHWFMHNRYKVGLRTNYFTFYTRLVLENGEYFIKEKEEETLNKNKVKEIKVNESKVKVHKKEDYDEEEWNNLMNELESQRKEREEDE